MDTSVVISAVGAAVSLLSAVVAVRAARNGRRSAEAGERSADAAEAANRLQASRAERELTEGYQPRWRFVRYSTPTPTPIFSFSRWPLSDEEAEEEKRLYQIRLDEVAEQQRVEALDQLRLYCDVVNDTGETAWGAEWTCPTESFLDEDDRREVRTPKDVRPNESLLSFRRRPPNGTVIVVTWFRTQDHAGDRQHWREVLPAE